jgi:hypothetical protein
LAPSYRLKFHRAIEHLQSLEAAVGRWLHRDACAVIEECEAKTRKHIVRIRVFEQPSDSLIPLLIGDCAHNARQALDHLAYMLAVHVAGSDPPPNAETTEFPILGKDTHQFDSELIKKIGPKSDVPSSLYTELEGLQPYHGGDRQLLAVLHHLDRLDKHRFLPVVAGIMQTPVFYIESLSATHIIGPRLGALEDGAVIIEYIPTPGTEVNMHAQFTASIAFHQRSPVAAGQPVIPLLNNILMFIEAQVWTRLEPFL